MSAWDGLPAAAGLAGCWVVAAAWARSCRRSWRNACVTTASAVPPPAAVPPPPPPLSRPQPGVTLHCLPCGCIWHYLAVQVDRCGPHAAHAEERAMINRLDQQIRNMP